jgi:hypothetical protein
MLAWTKYVVDIDNTIIGIVNLASSVDNRGDKD